MATVVLVPVALVAGKFCIGRNWNNTFSDMDGNHIRGRDVNRIDHVVVCGLRKVRETDYVPYEEAMSEGSDILQSMSSTMAWDIKEQCRDLMFHVKHATRAQ